MEYEYKEADFYTYCPKCKYKEKKDAEDPCNDCLAEPAVLHSRKPLHFKEKKEG